MKIKKVLTSFEPELTLLRQDFHQFPELGFKEYRTQEIIIFFLENLGITTAKIAGTGVTGLLEGGNKGKTILLRSDMDALPIQEETGLDFQSRNKGIMHACGHDGHMAMLLTAAKILASEKENLSGNVLFAFQPNEEDAGAWRMIEEGVIENYNVDAAFGCHLWNQLESGRIDICDGPIMAASHYFALTVKGIGGHAGFAHDSVDPVFVSSQIIQGVQGIQTRQINALYPIVIMFTHISGGSNPTIIPDSVVMEGSIRFLYEKGEEILKKFKQTVSDICRIHNAEFDLEFKVGNHMLSNNEAMAQLVRKSAETVLEGKSNVTGDIKTMAGEDFAEFANKVPSAFAFVGAKPEPEKVCYPHHHPKFDINEKSLIIGAELYARTSFDYLKGNT